MLQSGAVCCSVLQCVAAWCSVVQCVAVGCVRVMQRVAAWGSAVQCVAVGCMCVCCNVLQQCSADAECCKWFIRGGEHVSSKVNCVHVCGVCVVCVHGRVYVYTYLCVCVRVFVRVFGCVYPPALTYLLCV